MNLFLLSLFLLFSARFSYGGRLVNKDSTFVATFTVDERNGDVQMEIGAQTSGWVGVGWSSEEGSHQSADIVMWNEDNQGQFFVFDMYSPFPGPPLQDVEEDIQLVRANRQDNWVNITFKRKLNTPDGKEDVEILDRSFWVSWAFARDSDLREKHTRAGLVELNFFASDEIISDEWKPERLLLFGVDIRPAEFLLISTIIFVLIWGIFVWCSKGIRSLIHKTYLNKVEGSRVAQTEGILKRQPLKSGHARDPKGLFPHKTPGIQDMVHQQENKVKQEAKEEVDIPSDNEWFDMNENTPRSDDSPPLGRKVPSVRFKTVIEEELPPQFITPRMPTVLPAPVNTMYNRFTSFRIPHTQITVPELLIALFYVAFNVFVVYFMVAFTWYPANSWGQVSVTNSFLVCIPSTVNSLIGWFLNITFVKTIRFHRWLGRFLVLEITLHFLYWVIDWIRAGVLLQELLVWSNVWGIIAWLSVVLVFFTSLSFFRRHSWEIFFGSHYLFFAFYIFGVLHIRMQLGYAIAAAVVYFGDRVVRFWWRLFPTKTVEVAVKGSDCIKVVFKKHPFARYRIGQYVYANFPQVSLTEWHPYNLSNAPGEKDLEIHVKALGDHTKKLLELAKSRDHLWVRVDGPYGNWSIDLTNYSTLLLIGGGIGVTPLIAALRHIYGLRDQKSQERKFKIKTVYFLWICSTETVYEWFNETIESCRKREAPEFFGDVHVTKQMSVSNRTLHLGRPNLISYFKRIRVHSGAIGVLCCGPRQLVNAAWDETQKRNKPGTSWTFHYESYEF